MAEPLNFSSVYSSPARENHSDKTE